MNRINVIRSSMPPLEEYVEEIREIWDSRWLSNCGPKHQALENALSDWLGADKVSLFCNGHISLEAAFSLFPAGSEVITTPFTYASTTLAIARCGLTPVFCDIEPVFYTMAPEKIEALITEKTVAIAPVHVYGNLCDWRKIQKIAKTHNLKVIYDAAHAFGVRDKGIGVGSLGDISMFSLHATKVFHTIEGGCLTYTEPELSRRFAAWRQFGMYDKDCTEILGTNAKMTEFSAAMGLCNLRHLEEEITKRRIAAERYRERLEGAAGLIFCPKQSGITSNYAYMPVQVIAEQFGENRDELAQRLAEKDVYVRKYFYPLTSQFPYFQENFAIQDTPIAEEIADRILCLPLYADLTVEDVDWICDLILERHDN